MKFKENISDLCPEELSEHIVHVLCTAGSMSFLQNNVRYNVIAKDYIILTNISLVSNIAASPDFKAIIMHFPASFSAKAGLQSNYGVIGHLSLLQNPVMKLADKDFINCRDSLLTLAKRIYETTHLFQDELVAHLLSAHILDLFDIHSRYNVNRNISEHTAGLLSRFISMLHEGEYRSNREIAYYAKALCITPSYLSDICRDVSGYSAGYWIDRFTVSELARLLTDKTIPFNDIIDRLNFSSFSYFTRYTVKHLGMTPTQFRNR